MFFFGSDLLLDACEITPKRNGPSLHPAIARMCGCLFFFNSPVASSSQDFFSLLFFLPWKAFLPHAHNQTAASHTGWLLWLGVRADTPLLGRHEPLQYLGAAPAGFWRGDGGRTIAEGANLHSGPEIPTSAHRATRRIRPFRARRGCWWGRVQQASKEQEQSKALVW